MKKPRSHTYTNPENGASVTLVQVANGGQHHVLLIGDHGVKTLHQGGEAYANAVFEDERRRYLERAKSEAGTE